MGSPWTDESAILRDLSFAQGRWVPGGIDAAVAGAKPPTHNITEETEEEYFRHWTTDGDFSSGPDLIRIKRMLELVHDQEGPEEEFHTGPLEISKPSPAVSKFVPKRKDRTKVNKCPNTIKPRRARNVAIESILALANELAGEPLKLTKPEEFIKATKEIATKQENKRNDSLSKVTNWLQSQDITSMFKKKSSVNSLKESVEQNNNITGGGDVSNVKKSPGHSDGVKSPQSGKYTPSKWAQEYYEKAVDRSHMRDLVREDVWSRAEKIMKEIDAQKAEQLRKQKEEDEALAAAMAAAEAEPEPTTTTTTEPTTTTTTTYPTTTTNGDESCGESNQDNPEVTGIPYVLLPKTRHEFYSCDHKTCVVCQVLTVPSGQSTPKPTSDTKDSDSEDDESKSPTESGDKTETKDSSDASDVVNRYFGLVRTSLVENLFDADL